MSPERVTCTGTGQSDGATNPRPRRPILTACTWWTPKHVQEAETGGGGHTTGWAARVHHRQQLRPKPTTSGVSTPSRIAHRSWKLVEPITGVRRVETKTSRPRVALRQSQETVQIRKIRHDAFDAKPRHPVGAVQIDADEGVPQLSRASDIPRTIPHQHRAPAHRRQKRDRLTDDRRSGLQAIAGRDRNARRVQFGALDL